MSGPLPPPFGYGAPTDDTESQRHLYGPEATAFDARDAIEKLAEWRDAREAIFKAFRENELSAILKKDGIDMSALWGRLGNAEHALMDLARTLG